nr:uncharacterized protein LOC109153561 [Ipomoea batatas]
MNQGTFEPKRHHDILSAVLGKEDHPGSVRGVGSYSTIQGVFGRQDRKQSTSSGMYTADDVKKMIDKCRQDTIMEVEAKMQPKIDSMDQQLQFLMKNMSGTHLFSQGISTGTPQSVYAPYDPPICDPPPTSSSCHSVDTYPVTTIKNLSKEKKKMKDESCDLSATGTRLSIVDDDALKHLGDNCKYLVSLLTSVPLDKDYIDLEIDKSIFHHQNTTSIFVSMDDIKDLFTMNWLSVSIIQVFIL